MLVGTFLGSAATLWPDGFHIHTRALGIWGLEILYIRVQAALIPSIMDYVC
jgi:hypothetical protein